MRKAASIAIAGIAVGAALAAKLVKGLRRSTGVDAAAPPSPEFATTGGVPPANATAKELYEEARRLDIPGRSGMSKAELRRAIERKGTG